MKRLFFFIILILSIACSSDAEEPDMINQTDDEVVMEEESPEEGMGEEQGEENQTELFSFSVQVNGSYFNDFTIGKLYLSNSEGEIIAWEDLINNEKSSIELELDGDSEYDITFYKESVFEGRTNVDINTFIDVSSAEYSLTAAEMLNGNGDNFIVNFFDTGFPLEEINFFTRGVTASPANGGNYELDANLPNYPGSFYAAFLSPDDSSPRYYFGQDIDRNSSFQVDFKSLPFVENSINVEYPTGVDFFRVRLNGFYDYLDGVRLIRNVDESEISMSQLVYPNGIFDNYVLDASLVFGTTSQIRYQLQHFGMPESTSFTLPDLQGQILNSEMDAFNLTSNSAFHFGNVYYSFFDRDQNNSFYTFNVYKKGMGDISFSKKELLDNILSENLSLTADVFRFNYAELMNHSFIGEDEKKLIQTIIQDRREFPSGTTTEGYRFSN